MKLTFLGTGAAFTVGMNNYHSNAILEDGNGARLLIDCGSDIRHSLHDHGLDYQDITDVYVTHLHADHIGGLEWLGFSRKFDPDCNRPILYMSHALEDDIWNKYLSGTMESIEGQITTIESFFKPRVIPENTLFEWNNIEFQLIQTVHIMNGFSLSPCHGLLFTLGEQAIYYTADSQFCPQLLNLFYLDADIIFQDCETMNRTSGVHAHYDELITLDDDIKSKMWLYHYNPGPLPDAEADGFQGFVVKGQTFEF